MAVLTSAQTHPFQRQAVPPQAYTRDTLVKAINWLSGQPQSVRERATSADLIVSHYLQACRKLELQNETPVSGETFREDLKSLAHNLRQFDEPLAPPVPTHRPPSHGPLPSFIQEEPLTPPTSAFVSPSPVAPPSHFQPAAPAPSVPSHTNPLGNTKVISWQVDSRSLAMARELQQRLNLGSEVEGLRVLVTLGSERVRELFP